MLAAPAQAASDFLSLGILWSVRLEKPALAAPVADAARVYLPLRDGRVIAISLAEGRVAWSIDLPLTSRLAIDGNRLFGSTPDALVAIDTANGAISWRVTMRAQRAAPAARGGWVLAGENTDLLAFRATDGRLVWRQPLGAAVASDVTIDGDRVYVPLADSSLAALELTSGSVIWRAHTPAVPGPVTAAGQRLFAGCADDFFYAFDAKDGDRKWRWRAGADVLAPAAQDGQQVYFTSLDNVVRAVMFGSGVQKWRHPMDTRPLAGPVRDGDVVIVASASELRVLSTRDGKLAGRWQPPGELAVEPLFLRSASVSHARAVIVTGAATGDWRVYVLGRSAEPTPTPLKETPGRPLSPEGPPSLPVSPAPVASRRR